MRFEIVSVFIKTKQRRVVFFSTLCVVLVFCHSECLLACDEVHRLTGKDGSLLPRENPVGGTNCEWEIQVPTGHRIELTVRDFQINPSCCSCSKDYVEFRDGLNFASRLIGRYCANDKPKKVFSSQNVLTVKLVSSRPLLRKNLTSVNRFSAVYRTICGEFIRERSGVIRSPSNTNLTQIDRCLFTIVVPYGWIKVTFTDFTLGTRPNNCVRNFIAFKETAFVELEGTTQSQKHLCGELKSFYIFSKGRELSLLYQASQLSESKFEAKFMGTNTSVAPCGGLFRNDAGYIYSYGYPKSYPKYTECVWKIEVQYGYIRLEFYKLSWMQCILGNIEVYDGWSNNSAKISPNCRELSKKPLLKSHTHRLLIKATSKLRKVGAFVLSYKLIQQGFCEEGEFCCTNRKCINQRDVCNGVNNCSDGSDELNCPHEKPTKALYILWVFIVFIASALMVIWLWKTWRKTVHRTQRNQREDCGEEDDYANEVPSQSGAPPTYSEALKHTTTSLPSYEEALLNDNGGVILEQGNTNSVRFHARSDRRSRRLLPRRDLQRTRGRPGTNSRQSELAIL